MEGSCTTNQKIKECRPTQIKTRESNKQEENMPEKQKNRSVSTKITGEPRSVKIQTNESIESSSGEETMTQQYLFSMNRALKSRSYIDSGTSISNLFNKGLLTGLVKLDRTLKIQNGDEPIHILQIRSQQHLMLPISTCHYSENIIPNVSLVARFVNEYHTIYITSKMTMQYV